MQNESKLKKHIVIGITGGIGSGKSTACRYLASRGEIVIDADEVAREIVRPGKSAHAAIFKEFGDEFFLSDKTLDRKKLASYVFKHEDRLISLNRLLHPLIVNRVFAEADQYPGRVFIEAPLLIQTDMHKKTDSVWLIVADLETRIRRVMMRDALTKKEVENRIKSQMSDEAMIPYANEVIENSRDDGSLFSTLDELMIKSKYLEGC